MKHHAFDARGNALGDGVPCHFYLVKGKRRAYLWAGPDGNGQCYVLSGPRTLSRVTIYLTQ